MAMMARQLLKLGLAKFLEEHRQGVPLLRRQGLQRFRIDRFGDIDGCSDQAAPFTTQ